MRTNDTIPVTAFRPDRRPAGVDYESVPGDNDDFAHAVRWGMQWRCRCGARASIDTQARYIRTTCRRCGAVWEIAPSFCDSTPYTTEKGETMSHDIEPAPITDHMTIERRISRLEADRDVMCRQLNSVTNELFRHIARAAPDSEPETAGEGDAAKWDSVTNALVSALNHYPNPVDAHGVTNYGHAARWAVSRAISLGLASLPGYISPDDPRLQPLTEAMVGTIGDEIFVTLGRYGVTSSDADEVAHTIASFLNASRSADR